MRSANRMFIGCQQFKRLGLHVGHSGTTYEMDNLILQDMIDLYPLLEPPFYTASHD
jgi:hypothetical protein